MSPIRISQSFSVYTVGPNGTHTLTQVNWYPVVSCLWIFRTQTIRTHAQTFRTHTRLVRWVRIVQRVGYELVECGYETSKPGYEKSMGTKRLVTLTQTDKGTCRMWTYSSCRSDLIKRVNG